MPTLINLCYLATLIAAPSISLQTGSMEIVSRKEWGARGPKIAPEPMANPVPYVLIHHSATPAACAAPAACVAAMQWMQAFHQDERGWNDIGYSFGVGGDGRAYEGRGWSSVGAHAPGYNTQSVGICVIGNWMEALPPDDQLRQVHALIAFGVSSGYIAADYKLIGHRQARDTDCPGDRLFDEVKTWDRFCTDPVPVFGNQTKVERREARNGAMPIGLSLIFGFLFLIYFI